MPEDQKVTLTCKVCPESFTDPNPNRVQDLLEEHYLQAHPDHPIVTGK